MATQTVKNLSAMWETWVRSLSREDPLEKEMATHSSVLAWRIPWTEEPGGLQSRRLQSQTRLSDWTHILFQTLSKNIEAQLIYWLPSGSAVKNPPLMQKMQET